MTESEREIFLVTIKCERTDPRPKSLFSGNVVTVSNIILIVITTTFVLSISYQGLLL